MQKLVQGTLKQLVVLNTLLDALWADCIHISFNTPLNCVSAYIKDEAQVVECLLSESLILGERSDDFRRNNMHDGRQEVEEADVVIFVSIQQLHVIDGLQLNVLVGEIKLFASLKDYNYMVRNLASTYCP